MQLSKYAFVIKTSLRYILRFNETMLSIKNVMYQCTITNACMRMQIIADTIFFDTAIDLLRKNSCRNFSDLCSAMMIHSKMKKKVEKKSRIVTWESKFAINYECGTRGRERKRETIRQEGEAADHRQEITIASTGIPTAAL